MAGARAATFPTPALGDFAAPNELLVWPAPGQRPGSDRIQFTAFWPDENVPGRVRGQVFHTSLAEFTGREADRGHTVRVIQ